MRKITSLNGIWEFSLDKRFKIPSSYAVSVPSCIGYEIPALRTYRGLLWYRKKFDLSNISSSENLLLHFSAVNYYTEVYLNGVLIGSHEGGYTPFLFNISDFVKSKNDLVVKVLIPGENDPDYPFTEIPHGKQESYWYGPAAGIWQDVCLISTGKSYITKLFIAPDLGSSRALVTVKNKLDNTNHHYKLELSLKDPSGKNLKTLKAVLNSINEEEFSIENPMLWDTENPNLYTLVANIIHDERIIDSLTETFGMRSIEVREGELLLNQKPLYLMGALDQDFYPKTHYTPPNEEFVRDELILAKEMGLNCLRYHIKVPHRWYLKWADRLGLLIWVDLPNWTKSTEKAKLRGETTLEEMVEIDFNHPSVIIRTIINESWGLNLQNKKDRVWLKDIFNSLKSRDKSRLAVDNSACIPNFHIKTDIEDFHNYFAFPSQFSQMKSWVAELARRPEWTFGPDGERSKSEAIILSEFGNWSLPNLFMLRNYYGGDPQWFQLGYPQEGTLTLGMENRFWEYGMGKVFDSPEKLFISHQNLQGQALRFQVEEIRKHPEIKGYVITEFTDVYWEANGLLDITRRKKAFFGILQKMNAPDMIFPLERPTGVWSNQKVSIELLFSHLSAKKITNVEVRWNITETPINGKLIKKRIAFGLNELGKIEFLAPDVSEPKLLRLSLKAVCQNRKLNENEIDLFVVPKDLLKNSHARFSVYGESEQKYFSSDGIKLYPGEKSDIIYSTTYDNHLSRFADLGKTIILDLSDKSNFSGFGYTLRKREGIEEGKWVGGLGVIHQLIAGNEFKGNILDQRFRESYPTHYLQGEFNFHTKSLIGMFIGWMYRPMNFMVKIPLNEGELILTTFPLKKFPDSPVMKALFYQLVKNENKL